METCKVGSVTERRRTFWTTQVCARDESCGDDCATEYGFKLETEGQRRRISTANWIESIVYNILLTYGRRPDAPCGWRPGARGGHWSDSFRPNEYRGTSGSLITTLSAHKSIADALAELRTLVNYDLQRLIAYGVATSVNVEATYAGNNTAKLIIKIVGMAGETVTVGASLARVKNAWAWET